MLAAEESVIEYRQTVCTCVQSDFFVSLPGSLIEATLAIDQSSLPVSQYYLSYSDYAYQISSILISFIKSIKQVSAKNLNLRSDHIIS